MEVINPNIKTYSDWIIKCFATENLHLDFSIDSLKLLDRFIDDNTTNGQPNPNGILNKNHEEILFGIGIYLGETIKKHLPGSNWQFSDDTKSLLTGNFIMPNDAHIFPIEKVIKRFENGSEDELYSYGVVVIDQMSKNDFWDSSKTDNKKTKSKWWKFW